MFEELNSEDDSYVGFCVSDDCNARVVKNESGTYVCEGCGRVHSNWEMEYQEAWRGGDYHEYCQKEKRE